MTIHPITITAGIRLARNAINLHGYRGTKMLAFMKWRRARRLRVESLVMKDGYFINTIRDASGDGHGRVPNAGIPKSTSRNSKAGR
jgi:hypothetical protein